MKRVMNGKTYNTDTATAVAWYEYEDDKGYETKATVYQNRGGAFFIVHTWVQSDINDEPERQVYFEETDREQIETMIVEGRQIEVLDEKALVVPPEAEAEAEPATTAYLRLPPALKLRIEWAATSEGLSLNAWAIRCFENCVGQKEKSDATVVALKSL